MKKIHHLNLWQNLKNCSDDNFTLNIFWSKIVYFCFFCWWFSYTYLWSVRVHPQFCPLSNLGMDLDWPVIHNPYRWSWNHINYPLTHTWKENRETWLYAKTSQFNFKKKFSNRLKHERISLQIWILDKISNLVA